MIRRSLHVRAAVASIAMTAALLLFSSLHTAPAVHAEEHRSGWEVGPYASPLEIAVSPDGARLYVLCQGAEEVRVLSSTTFAVIKTIAVGRVPRGLSLSRDGARLYVTNSADDTLSLIDTRKLVVTANFRTGFEPSGVVEDSTATHLFVADRISNDIAVLDAKTGEQQKRLSGGRGASYLALSPDGKQVYASHVYPNQSMQPTPGGNRTVPQSEITIIDTARAVVTDRIQLPAIAGLFHIAFTADGSLAAVAQYHPKNLVPLAHLEHGGAFQDSLTLFGPALPTPIEVPLDEIDRYASQPFSVLFTPDRQRLFVSLGGSEAVLAISVPKLLAYIHAHPGSFANDLSASGNYVVARIPVGRNPRGLALSRDGARLFVANRLDDTISVIDAHTNKVLRTVQLKTPAKISAVRAGEQRFYSARQSFQGQIACATCHIDSTFDGLTWDLEPDGFGVDIVDNRLIEDLRDTEPYKWNGGNPNIPTECGPRTEKYFWRSEQWDNLALADLSIYLRSVPRRASRWRLAGRALSPAQDRGLAIFNRERDKFGKPIADANRCATCHSGPKGTNQKSFDVGTGKATDRSGLLDTPQLSNIALTAPYLHDGSARTLEEIWTVYNPNDKHGRTNDLTKDELNDLIEYLRTR